MPHLLDGFKFSKGMAMMPAVVDQHHPKTIYLLDI